MSLPQRVQNGPENSDWHGTVFTITFEDLCVFSSGHAGVRGNGWADTGRQSRNPKWLASKKKKMCSVEELETLFAGMKPRTSHHQMSGREKCKKRKCSTILKGWKRAIINQTNIGSFTGETAERWGGACMGFPDHIDTILNWTKTSLPVSVLKKIKTHTWALNTFSLDRTNMEVFRKACIFQASSKRILLHGNNMGKDGTTCCSALGQWNSLLFCTGSMEQLAVLHWVNGTACCSALGQWNNLLFCTGSISWRRHTSKAHHLHMSTKYYFHAEKLPVCILFDKERVDKNLQIVSSCLLKTPVCIKLINFEPLVFISLALS